MYYTWHHFPVGYGFIFQAPYQTISKWGGYQDDKGMFHPKHSVHNNDAHQRGFGSWGLFWNKKIGQFFLFKKKKKIFLHWIGNEGFSANCWAASCWLLTGSLNVFTVIKEKGSVKQISKQQPDRVNSILLSVHVLCKLWAEKLVTLSNTRPSLTWLVTIKACFFFFTGNPQDVTLLSCSTRQNQGPSPQWGLSTSSLSQNSRWKHAPLFFSREFVLVCLLELKSEVLRGQ